MSDIFVPPMIPFRPPPGLSLPGEDEHFYFPLHPGGEHYDSSCDDKVTTPEGSSSPITDPVSEDKEVRKLEKKLRDICKLETRLAAGEKLDPLQVRKIEKKSELEEDLEALKERLGKELAEGETQLDEQLAPPPGFDCTSAGKLGFASVNKLHPGAALGGLRLDNEDDATTLPGSTASDQGGDSDSESQVSELRSQRLSASAPAFVPQPPPGTFAPVQAMPFVPTTPFMPTMRTPLRNTAALFTPNSQPAGGKLRQDAPVFVPGVCPPLESAVLEEEEEETVTWVSTRSKLKMPEEKPRTKLTTGSAELFVPQFPDLQASVDMKMKDRIKAKKVSQA